MSVSVKFCNLNFATLVLRFYLLIGIVIGAFFAGVPWLSILALPVFFVSMLVVEFKLKATQPAVSKPSLVLENVGMHLTAH